MKNKTNKANTESEILVLTAGMPMIDRIGVDFPDEPRSGRTQYTDKAIEEHIGGHPINVSIDLVALGMSPHVIGVVGSVGQDSGGDLLEEELRKRGIKSFLKRTSTPTGQNLIIVPKDRDRSFNIGPGANLALRAEDVRAILEKEKPHVLSIRPGYSGIDGSMPAVLGDLAETFVLLDIIKPFQRDWSYIIPALQHVNAIHCNDIEAMKITGTDSEEKAIEALLSYGLDLLFVTLGEKGAYLVTPNERIQQPGIGDKGIDPTGAGDAFCAGVIQKLIEWNVTREPEKLSRAQLEELLWYAQAVGAAAATGVGTTAGVSAERVQEILASRTE